MKNPFMFNCSKDSSERGAKRRLDDGVMRIERRIPRSYCIAVSYTHLDVYKRQYTGLLFADVGKTLVENGLYMAVGQRVADAAAVAPEFHEVRLLEDCLLYTSRFRGLYPCGVSRFFPKESRFRFVAV